MARLCSICGHSQVGQINRELLAEAPHRVVASKFGLSASAIFRHSKHIMEAPADAVEPGDTDPAVTVESEVVTEPAVALTPEIVGGKGVNSDLIQLDEERAKCMLVVQARALAAGRDETAIKAAHAGSTIGQNIAKLRGSLPGGLSEAAGKWPKLPHDQMNEFLMEQLRALSKTGGLHRVRELPDAELSELGKFPEAAKLVFSSKYVPPDDEASLPSNESQKG
jgi:hypothetical protein